VIRRSTVKNLKRRLIYTTDDDDDDDKTTTGGVPSSYNDDWGRQRRRFIPLVTKLGQATTKMTLMILDLMTLDTDTEHWCFTAVEWCSEMLIWSVYMGTHGWIGLPRIRSIATTRYINVRLFLDCLCLFGIHWLLVFYFDILRGQALLWFRDGLLLLWWRWLVGPRDIDVFTTSLFMQGAFAWWGHVKTHGHGFTLLW